MVPSTQPNPLARLTPRERRVLDLMAGTIDGYRRSVEQVARRFGVTPEKIRLILVAAKEKLDG